VITILTTGLAPSGNYTLHRRPTLTMMMGGVCGDSGFCALRRVDEQAVAGLAPAVARRQQGTRLVRAKAKHDRNNSILIIIIVDPSPSLPPSEKVACRAVLSNPTPCGHPFVSLSGTSGLLWGRIQSLCVKCLLPVVPALLRDYRWGRGTVADSACFAIVGVDMLVSEGGHNILCFESHDETGGAPGHDDNSHADR
jgi:hypothetical protein